MVAPVNAAGGDAPPVDHHSTFWEKVGQIAKMAAKAIASVVLFLYNPIVFTLSLLFGIVLKEQTEQALERIREVANRHFKVAVIVIPCMMLLAIPATPLIFCCAMGCYVGSKL